MDREEHECQCGCCKKQKRKDKYKDILEYIEMYVKLAVWSQREDVTMKQLMELNNDINYWLEEEV